MQLNNTVAGIKIRCLLFISLVLAICPGLQTTAEAQDLFPLQQGGPHPGKLPPALAARNIQPGYLRNLAGKR